MKKKTSAPGTPGPAGGKARGERAKDFGGSMRKLIRYLGGYKVSVLAVLVFAVASTVFSILGPKILGEATDTLFSGVLGLVAGTGGGIDFGKIGRILLRLAALYAASAVFSGVQGYLMTNVSMRVTYRLRRDIAAKIQKLPFSYYDRVTNGEVLSRITNDVDAVSQSLSQSVTQIITSVTTLVGILVMMFTISGVMTLVALCILPLSLVFVLFLVGRSQKHFRAQQEYLGRVNGHIEEMYASHIVVKAFNGEKESEEKFGLYNGRLYASAWKSQFLSGLMMPVMTFIGNLGYVAVCILGGFLAANGRISVGDIQAFMQYVRQFTQPITQVANISGVLQQTAAASERVFAFLEEPEEVPEPSRPVRVNTGGGPDTELCVGIRGGVRFDHVRFGYQPDRIVIRDFSAAVDPGEKIAIVGPTGAGKTTVVKLLMRFYDVNGGAILVDGHDIRDFARGDLRSIFGMVLQDAWLYNASIADNIRYGRLGATDEEVREAAKTAQVDHFIRTLPEGYGMVLNEDADNISQGQKQLLTIARAVLADPRILILDEATSSVDTRTEALIQKAMDNLMKGRTSFVIAHRLSTVRDADLILVMKDGDIVEQGKHFELLEKKGFYAELYNSQFEKVS